MTAGSLSYGPHWPRPEYDQKFANSSDRTCRHCSQRRPFLVGAVLPQALGEKNWQNSTTKVGISTLHLAVPPAHILHSTRSKGPFRLLRSSQSRGIFLPASLLDLTKPTNACVCYFDRLPGGLKCRGLGESKAYYVSYGPMGHWMVGPDVGHGPRLGRLLSGLY